MTNSTHYEYFYPDRDTCHHHSYLIKPLRKILNQTILILTNKPKYRILDLGCGNGSLSNSIVPEGCELVGVEESRSGVNLARENYPHLNFIQGSIYNLPSDKLGDKFDIVISVGVIEHLLYPKELVRAAKKCLKPKGKLIITTPYHGYLKNLVLALTKKMNSHFTVLWDNGHIKFFSVATLTKLLASEGYTDIKFNFFGRFPWLWKCMICSSTPLL